MINYLRFAFFLSGCTPLHIFLLLLGSHILSVSITFVRITDKLDKMPYFFLSLMILVSENYSWTFLILFSVLFVQLKIKNNQFFFGVSVQTNDIVKFQYSKRLL